MSEPAIQTVYILRELFTCWYGEKPQTGGKKTPAVHAFATADEARFAKERLEREAIEQHNPFLAGDSLADWTSLSEAELLQRLRRADMEPPLPGSTRDDWRTWAQGIEHLTPAQITVLRHALDRQQFYALEARRVPFEPEIIGRAYVVQRLDWQQQRYGYGNELSNDEPVKAFRSRARAEAHRCELEEGMEWTRTVNPCAWAGGVQQASSLKAVEIVRRLQAMGAPTPPEHDFSSNEWWNSLRHWLSPSQQRIVRELFDKVHWFEVVEVEVEA